MYTIDEIKDKVYEICIDCLDHDQVAAIGKIHEKAIEFLIIINDSPNSREKDLAIARIEEALMWAVKAIGLPRRKTSQDLQPL